MARDIVWAKVPGWNWWPAIVLPGPDNARETRGTRSIRKDDENERVVLFLVDKTVARVPRELPAFTQHYTRFLSATYSNKKLFQAVEEARSLAHEGPGAGAGQQEAMQQQLIAYPPPVRDDFKKTSRQLLQWLKAAALDPLAPLNKLSDQSNKRVLHAVHDNRLVSEDAKHFVLPPETIIPDGPVAPAPAPAQHSIRSGVAHADATTEQLPAKRQRKPQAWLQMYGDLPESLVRSSSSTAAAGCPATVAAKAVPAAVAAVLASPEGQKASQLARSSSASAPKPGGHLAKLRQQQQQLARQHTTAQKGPQPVNAAAAIAANSSVPQGYGRKRARSVVLDDYVVVEGSDSEPDSEESSIVLTDGCGDDDDVQQQQQQQRRTPCDRSGGIALAKQQSAAVHPRQSLQQRSKKRCPMNLVDSSKPVAAATSTAAAAAAAVAAAFRGVNSTAARPGSLGSGSRVGRRQQQQQQMLQEQSCSDSDGNGDGYCSQWSESDMSDGERTSMSRHRKQQTLSRRTITPRQPWHHPTANGVRCDSPQLLRPQASTHRMGFARLDLACSRAGDASSGCCCCCGRHQHGSRHSVLRQRQAAAEWLNSHDMLASMGVGVCGAAALLESYPAAPVDLRLPACCLQQPISSPAQRQVLGHQQQQQQLQQQITDGDGEMSLVEVEALADSDLFTAMTQEDGLTSPSSILTAACAPLCPAASHPPAVISNRACTIPLLRPPSPLLGAAPVVAVGAELLPGLEEDLQHAAVMFGSSSDTENSLQQQQQRKDTHPGQPDAGPTVAGEGYMSDGASAAAAIAEETCAAPLELQPTLTDAEMTAAAVGEHPESPSTGSHAGLHFMPGWDLDVITSGPQDSELQAEIAAAAVAASSAAAAASARASVEIPAVLGYKRAPLHRSASSTGEDVRRLALARSGNSPRNPDVHSQLQDCREQLHASTEIVRQLKQQLEAKDDQIAAINSQTSAQAKQLQQQAGELMALRALLGKQQKQTGAAASANATALEPFSKASAPSTMGHHAAEVVPAAGSAEQCAPGPGTAAAGGDVESTSPQPTRRSTRLSAVTKAAAKDSVTSVFPAVTSSCIADQQDGQQKQYADKDDEIADLRLQLSDTKLAITELEVQLQDVTGQMSSAAQQHQAEAAQLRGWLQAAEIDAALTRNENELLKKVLPGSVVSKVSTTARKQSGKAAGGAAVAGKAEGRQTGTSKRGGGPRSINTVKALLASQKAAGGAAGQPAAAGPATGGSSTAAVEQAEPVLQKQATAAGQPVASPVLTALMSPTLAAAATSKAADVFTRQPRLPMPLQAMTLPAGAAANSQTLAAALATLREAAAANTNTCVSNTNSALTMQTKSHISITAANAAVSGARASTSASQPPGPTFISLGTSGNNNGVSGPMVLLRPTGNLPLATMLQLNAALSQLAANASRQASVGVAAPGVKQVQVQSAAATVTSAAAGVSSAAGHAHVGARQTAANALKPSSTPVLALNSPGCASAQGASGVSKTTPAALAQFTVTSPLAGGAAATAVGQSGGSIATAASVQPKAGAKPGLNLNDP